MYSFKGAIILHVAAYSFLALGSITAVFCMNSCLSMNLRTSSMRLLHISKYPKRKTKKVLT